MFEEEGNYIDSGESCTNIGAAAALILKLALFLPLSSLSLCLPLRPDAPPSPCFYKPGYKAATRGKSIYT